MDVVIEESSLSLHMVGAVLIAGCQLWSESFWNIVEVASFTSIFQSA